MCAHEPPLWLYIHHQIWRNEETSQSRRMGMGGTADKDLDMVERLGNARYARYLALMVRSFTCGSNPC